MTSERFVQAVARHLVTRLHQSSSGYRCRCGSCRHQIVATAIRTGIPGRRLVAALPGEAPAEREPRKGRPVLTSQVASSVTVSRGRRRLQGPAAVLSVIGTDDENGGWEPPRRPQSTSPAD